MKTIKIISLLFAMAFMLQLQAQKTYVTTMKFTFSGGSEFGAPIGNDCGNMDVTKTVNSIDGIMQLDVNKVCHTYSFLQHWMGGTYAQSIVFNQRYIEMRIKSTAVHKTGCSVGFQVSGGNPETTPIPACNYSINEPDTWEIKFFRLGGDADTIFKEIDYFFENGTYYIDYVLLGDAAAPVAPTIDQVPDQHVIDNSGVHSVILTNILIPNRDVTDGLVVSASTSKNGIIRIIDLTQEYALNPSEPLKYNLKYEPVPGMSGLLDSIYVKVKDTIRGTQTVMGFEVSMLMCVNLDCGSLAEISSRVQVYPSVADNIITADFSEAFTGAITISDIEGRQIILKKIYSEGSTTFDISALSPGMYFVRISDPSGSVTRKILKK